MDWYSKSREAIQRCYGDKWALFTLCLAATSMHRSLAANVTLARKAFNQIEDTGTIKREGFCKAEYNALLSVIRGELPKGIKVRNFCKALLGDKNAVTVDVWMARLFLGKDQPTRKEYLRLANKLSAEAKALNRSPAEHQAKLWQLSRGKKSSYADYLQQGNLI